MVAPRMHLKTRLVAAAAAMALLLGAAGGALSAEESPYPVWWSPVLELESLDHIDQRLERKLWHHGGEIEVSKGAYDRAKSKIVDTCVSAIELSEKGYWGRGNHNHKILLLQLAKCRAIEMLKRARPAQVSYVRDFVLDRGALGYLPAMVGIAPSCSGRCWQYAANEKRIAWSKVETFLSMNVKRSRELQVETEGWSDWIEILARADFNGDGLEDIVLINNSGATQGTYGATNVFLLSREAPEGVMRVLDAERYLCPKYQCDADYDFSDILR